MFPRVGCPRRSCNYYWCRPRGTSRFRPTFRSYCLVLNPLPPQISTAVTSSLNTIRSSIQNDVAAANSVISSAVSAINKVTSIVNVNLNVPQFNIPSLTLLQNVTIPADFENSLLKLNSSLPTLSELRDAVNSVSVIPPPPVAPSSADPHSTVSKSRSLR